MLNKSSNLRKVILGAVAGAFVAIGATGAIAYPPKPVTFTFVIFIKLLFRNNY